MQILVSAIRNDIVRQTLEMHHGEHQSGLLDHRAGGGAGRGRRRRRLVRSGDRAPAASSPRSTSSSPTPTGWSSTSPATPPTPTTPTGSPTRSRGARGVTVRKVSDRTFLLHLGGKIEVDAQGPAQAPRRPVPRLHPGRRPGLPGDRREPRRRPPADHQAQHRRRRHRRLGRARPRQHRPGRRAAGDGGQGRAVQAVRRRRRLAGRASTPRTPTRSSGSSRRSPRSTAASTSRTSPRRAASRSSARLRDDARHPGLPRRPARHRDRRARRADQRAAGGRQAARRRADRGLGRRRRRHAIIRLLLRQGATDIIALRPARRPAPRHARACTTPAVAGSPSNTNPTRLHRRPWRRCCAGADVFIGVSRAEPARPATTSRRWPTDAIVFALANPDPEVDPSAARRARRGRRDRPLRLPQPDQQRAGVPRLLPRDARRRRPRDHRGDA